MMASWIPCVALWIVHPPEWVFPQVTVTVVEVHPTIGTGSALPEPPEIYRKPFPMDPVETPAGMGESVMVLAPIPKDPPGLCGEKLYNEEMM